MSRSVAEHGIYVGNSGDRPVIRRNHVCGQLRQRHPHERRSQPGRRRHHLRRAVVEANVIHGNGRDRRLRHQRRRRAELAHRQQHPLRQPRQRDLALPDRRRPASRNNFVAHNTIVQAADGRWAINIQDGSTGNHVVNNILLTLHTFRGAIDISSDSLSGFVSDSNAVTGRFTTNGGNSLYSRWSPGERGHRSGCALVHPTTPAANLRRRDRRTTTACARRIRPHATPR